MRKIIEVKTRRDINRFIHFPLDLYKGNEFYVPMLIGDEKKIFNKNYIYNTTCDTVFYLCVDENDRVIGRIEGIIQKAANEKWKQKRVRFTRFDMINDQEVANMLLDAVASWGKERDMEEIVGPLGYSDLEREGLLIDGFDKIQTYEEQYNFDYYQYLIDNYGLVKDVDWLEYKLYAPKKPDPRFETLAKKVADRYELTVYQPKSIRKFIKEYKEQFFDIIDKTYNHIYGTVPFTKGMMDSSISNFILLLRPQDIVIVLDKNKVLCGFCLVFPSISKIVTKYKGKIGLKFLIEFFKNKKNPEIIDLGLIGVLPEYSSKGAASIVVDVMYKQFLNSKNLVHLETNLMLEENLHILTFMSNFEKEYTKKRRCYVKKI